MQRGYYLLNKKQNLFNCINTLDRLLLKDNQLRVLDAALLRPGRFDRIITVALPDKNSRKDILKVHSKNKNLDSNINLELIAEMTGGFSGAQIKNLLNEAAINAARSGNSIITETNILEALDKLVVGLIRKIDTRSEDSRRRIAIHETGHALLCNYFNDYFEAFTHISGFNIFYYPDHNNDKINILKNEILIFL